MNTTTIRLTFAGSLGHELAARLDLPLKGVRAYTLFAHCFTFSCNYNPVPTPAAGACPLAHDALGQLGF